MGLGKIVDQYWIGIGAFATNDQLAFHPTALELYWRAELQIFFIGYSVGKLDVGSNAVPNTMPSTGPKAPWLPEFEAELFTFPNARHDDQADSMTQALAYDKSGSGTVMRVRW